MLTAAYFDKPRGKAVDVGPHADSGGKRNGATLWVALDRADLRNGCLCYLKGSHVADRGAQTNDAMCRDTFKHIDEKAPNAMHFIAEPGDAIIHSSLTVHWSRKPEGASSPRRALSFFYWAADAADLVSAPGSHMTATLDARL